MMNLTAHDGSIKPTIDGNENMTPLIPMTADMDRLIDETMDF